MASGMKCKFHAQYANDYRNHSNAIYLARVIVAIQSLKSNLEKTWARMDNPWMDSHLSEYHFSSGRKKRKSRGALVIVFVLFLFLVWLLVCLDEYRFWHWDTSYSKKNRKGGDDEQ